LARSSLGLVSLVAACLPDVIPTAPSDAGDSPSAVIDGGNGDSSDAPTARCTGIAPTCGPDGKIDCCVSDHVEAAEYDRANDPSAPASVSAFELDRFEVTVGRFRRFVEAYPTSKPRAGDATHPRVTGSGWNDAWNENLPGDGNALRQSLHCDANLDANYETWSDAVGSAENRPINCVSWYLAFAFCAWDHGRLPTEAEWNAAAAAGSEQRLYPWGQSAPEPTRAVFGCTDDQTSCVIPRVGSTSPSGDGLWHHADLAGSLSEWMLDFHGVFPTPCIDCAVVDDGGQGRETRGGDFAHAADGLETTFRVGHLPSDQTNFVGFRCARDAR
jgi:formylglycine-generating enzyme required for sulfatase activity